MHRDGVQAARLAEAKRAHLCGMAAKLAYEDPLTIADAVTRWGFAFLTDQKVPCRFLLPVACSLVCSALALVSH